VGQKAFLVSLSWFGLGGSCGMVVNVGMLQATVLAWLPRKLSKIPAQLY